MIFILSFSLCIVPVMWIRNLRDLDRGLVSLPQTTLVAFGHDLVGVETYVLPLTILVSFFRSCS